MLGSGELGKEFVISAQRYGCLVIAVDRYHEAPAMQVADAFEVIDMKDGDKLDELVKKYEPDIIVPEIEAINTLKLFQYERRSIQVVPSARAVNITMNRKALRELASKKLKLKTAKYCYAKTFEELEKAIEKLGLPCVVKPLMSSSGKGQTIIKNKNQAEFAWEAAGSGRGSTPSLMGQREVIVEEFINFDTEITILTVTQKEGVGETLFCPPIGHKQKKGDYQCSWQPAYISEEKIEKAQKMAKSITDILQGSGIWGAEFFVTKDDVYFSELSPRPHDTGMVTLANTQDFNEFELHIRAILGYPIHENQIGLVRYGASAVITSNKEINKPKYIGIEKAAAIPNTDFRIFGKPNAYEGRRMGVALAWKHSGFLAPHERDGPNLVKKAQSVADCISIVE